jgi:dihydroorotate dehydrogenase (NAD+) catalytic subunit
MPVDMRTRLGLAELPNPVLAASGCAGAGRELANFTDVARIGALVSKSIMAEPWTGNPSPRLTETPSGILNSVGLQGPGIDAFLQRDLPWLLSRGARVVVSIAGQIVREYAALATRLSDAAGVTAIEVNLSCPNAEDAGRIFAIDAQAAGAVVAAVRASARYDIPVFAKLSPDVTDIVTVARACVAAGADCLSLINAPLGMAIDPDTMRPALAVGYGGLSGPAIRPIAVRCVWQVREALPDVSIIGTGGVRSGRDALEMLLAGASAVGVGTAILHDPSACSRVLRELEEELSALGVDRATDVVGGAHGTRPVRRLSPEAVQRGRAARPGAPGSSAGNVRQGGPPAPRSPSGAGQRQGGPGGRSLTGGDRQGASPGPASARGVRGGGASPVEIGREPPVGPPESRDPGGADQQGGANSAGYTAEPPRSATARGGPP